MSKTERSGTIGDAMKASKQGKSPQARALYLCGVCQAVTIERPGYSPKCLCCKSSTGLAWLCDCGEFVLVTKTCPHCGAREDTEKELDARTLGDAPKEPDKEQVRYHGGCEHTQRIAMSPYLCADGKLRCYACWITLRLGSPLRHFFCRSCGAQASMDRSSDSEPCYRCDGEMGCVSHGQTAERATKPRDELDGAISGESAMKKQRNELPELAGMASDVESGAQTRRECTGCGEMTTQKVDGKPVCKECLKPGGDFCVHCRTNMRHYGWLAEDGKFKCSTCSPPKAIASGPVKEGDKAWPRTRVEEQVVDGVGSETLVGDKPCPHCDELIPVGKAMCRDCFRMGCQVIDGHGWCWTCRTCSVALDDDGLPRCSQCQNGPEPQQAYDSGLLLAADKPNVKPCLHCDKLISKWKMACDSCFLAGRSVKDGRGWCWTCRDHTVMMIGENDAGDSYRGRLCLRCHNAPGVDQGYETEVRDARPIDDYELRERKVRVDHPAPEPKDSTCALCGAGEPPFHFIDTTRMACEQCCLTKPVRVLLPDHGFITDKDGAVAGKPAKPKHFYCTHCGLSPKASDTGFPKCRPGYDHVMIPVSPPGVTGLRFRCGVCLATTEFCFDVTGDAPFDSSRIMCCDHPMLPACRCGKAYVTVHGDKCDACQRADSPVLSDPVLHALDKAGVIAMSERVVIDLRLGEPIRVYEQKFASQGFIDIVMGDLVIAALTSAEKTSIEGTTDGTEKTEDRDS